MKYKNIIFDMDGTLLESHYGLVKGFQSALNMCGIEESFDNIKKLIGPPLERTIREKYKVEEQDAVKAMEHFGEYLTNEGLYECNLFDGIPYMLNILKNNDVQMSVATSAPAAYAEIQLKHLGIRNFFNIIEGNNLNQTRGSKSDFIKNVIELKKYRKQYTIMVGDKEPDITGGKKNNLHTIGVLYGYGSNEEINNASPKYKAKHPEEILDIVLR